MAYKQDQIREYKYILPENLDVSLFGALRSGIAVRAELRVPYSFKSDGVTMCIHSDGYEGEIKYVKMKMEKTVSDGEDDVYCVEFNTGELSRALVGGEYGLFYYDYAVNTPSGIKKYGGEDPTVLEDSAEAGERQFLIYAEKASSSEAIKTGIIYHIFVDRFNRSGKCGVKEGAILDPNWDRGIPQYGEYPGADVSNNVFFGGDLYGVTEKLPYIASLGVSTIYLSPVFDAASNHKYDTADYLTVDSMFGGDEALRELCAEAKKYGIGIMLDGVFNHTGSDSVYFDKESRYDSVGAYESKKSSYYDWFNFKTYPDEYECWWGVKILPRVNSAHESYRSFICDEVVDKWMKAGVSHWRLDVADELSEVFLSHLEEKVHSMSSDAQIIGEVWEDASDKVSYGRRRHYLSSGQLSSVMNYPLRSAILSYIAYGDDESLRRATEGLYRRYPKHVSDTLMNFLGTHDTERALTVLGDADYFDLTNDELSVRNMACVDREAAVRKLKEAYAMICALPGVPCVFYGDEAGMEGYRDPFCRKPFPWKNIDSDIFDEYQKLGNIRKNETLLRDALFEIEELTPERFVFVRRPVNGAGYSLVAVINNTDEEMTYSFDGVLADYDGNVHDGKVILAPRGWIYLKK